MPQTLDPEVLSMRMPSRLELLGILDGIAMSLCERLKFDADAASQVAMSVIEAGTNAIQHGHQRDATKPVDIEFLMYSDRIEINVHDTGPGFDPDSINGDATSPEHLLDLRGRGIFIMRACMDSVTFDFRGDGTVCHLVKHRPNAG
jgi:serine/threonine-protein kinase RsbW